MANTPKSFEEFYHSLKKDIFDIDVVIDYAEEHEGELGEYEGNMICPECKQAKLFFVHKSFNRRAHLKKYPSENHDKECSFNYEYASKRTVKKYVDSLSYDQIQDKLNSIMNMLCKKHVFSSGVNGTSNTCSKKSENPMLIIEKKKETEILKALRRKKLNGWIDKTDGEDFCVFYGKVKLQVSEKTKEGDAPEDTYKYYLLQIYTQNKKGEWKFRTNIYRGSTKDPVDEESVYNIVLIGNLDFNFKPFTIKLANRNAIKYKKS